jgi:hypothetical protein
LSILILGAAAQLGMIFAWPHEGYIQHAWGGGVVAQPAPASVGGRAKSSRTEGPFFFFFSSSIVAGTGQSFPIAIRRKHLRSVLNISKGD